MSKIEPEMNKKPAYKDTTLSVEKRVEDLLGRMTLEEKFAQLGCVTAAMGFFSENRDEQLKNGIGQISVFQGSFTKEMNVEMINSTQEFLMNHTRLGIPAMFHIETLNGSQTAQATCYPIPMGLASTFDPEMVEKMTSNIRKELNAIRMKLALAPVMDVARDPRWGRVGETYGENPTLVSEMSVAYVKGLQGDDLKNGVAATAKHFIGYAMGEGGMNISAAHIGPRELREVYAKPFEAAIRMAGLEGVMNAYHVIDGKPVIANKEIFDDLLRGELGFSGLTISDYGSIEKLDNVYHVVEDATEAGIMALKAGMDTETPSVVCYNKGMQQAVNEGKLDVSLIDRAVRRVLSLKMRLGLFENPYSSLEKVNSLFQNTESLNDAYKLACESIVLLKNDNGMLPLIPNKYKKIAVIGPNADDLRALFGGYTVPAVHEMMYGMITGRSGGSEGVEMSPDDSEMAKDLIARFPSPEQIMKNGYPGIQTVAEAVRNAFSNCEVSVVRGCDILGTSMSGFEEAVTAARESELAIVVVGGKNGSGSGCSMGENVDSTSVGLPGVQEELVREISAVQKNIVLVHMDGRPLSSVWIAEKIPAILEAWHPGQCGARAIVDTIVGKYNPAGKLPMTAVRDSGQIPIYADQLRGSGMSSRGLTNSSVKSGYVDQTGNPLYAFGHGISYTDFKLDELGISKRKIAPDGETEITCSITNTGNYSGEEVVQLYYTDVIASVVRPIQELAGFVRVSLKPGQKKKVCFRMKASQCAFLDADMRWKIEKGEILLRIGVSSADIRLEDSVMISEDMFLPNGDREFFTRATVFDSDEKNDIYS